MANSDQNARDTARTCLYSLPNEILVSILSPLSTRALLPIILVSHRLYALISRILHYRLSSTAPLHDYKLILECYHPSCKATEPYLFCNYLGTDGLEEEEGGKHAADGLSSVYENCAPTARLGRLEGLYSRFRPRPVEWDAKMRVRSSAPPVGAPMVAGGGGGGGAAGPTNGATAAEPFANRWTSNGNGNGLVSHSIILDGYEHFSQLCTMAHLVRKNAFPTRADLADGIVRLWRQWLAERARWDTDEKKKNKEEEGRRNGGVAGRDMQKADKSDVRARPKIPVQDDPSILWVDGLKTIGLKLRVEERTAQEQIPVLMHRDENITVNYEVEFEELVIRTTKLLFAVEKSREEEDYDHSKAVIFGTFTRA
ncbi:hypothetical protein AJ80_00205 [Polytolypa hystricis UAMH7299]|uniref:F-box domain-containing protein n=1 Tax=Polytolypa hystricis (strain UAMH7299) TaxID=1447883 RepID=A0A2B7Z3L6_POLH7|nr:hypothetical protein AJ80_00205 [Polytolypa hystricis UAMH7299]